MDIDLVTTEGARDETRGASHRTLRENVWCFSLRQAATFNKPWLGRKPEGTLTHARGQKQLIQYVAKFHLSSHAGSDAYAIMNITRAPYKILTAPSAYRTSLPPKGTAYQCTKKNTRKVCQNCCKNRLHVN